MFDVVIPEGNEEEFIDMALLLGYSEIVFLSSNPRYTYASDRITIKRAYLLKNTSEISKVKKYFDYLFAFSERKFFEQKIDFIIGAEHNDSRDSFHFRKTSLNQVHAKLCKENNIAIAFGFDSLIRTKYFSQLQIVLGLIIQNAVLIKKYKIDYNAFSMTKDPLLMKPVTILDALLRVIKL
jgi:hypothetical protein